MAPPRLSDKGLASSIFVNRDGPKRVFEDAAFSIPATGCSIRTWYGVGGQGKTALARKLFRMSSPEADPSYAHLRRAMLDLHGRSKTDPDRLLVWIRNGFSKAGVSFHAFDLAFAIMWQKTRGEEPLPDFEKPWLHRTGEALTDSIPETVALTRETLEEFAETIPVLGFLLKRGVTWSIDKGKRAYLERTRPQLQKFYRDGRLIEDYEMSGLMPWMLAQDLNRHLSENPDDRFVLFVDEYERVTEGAGTGRRWLENPFDDHMRRFIAETDGLLALFFLRERLPWEDDPDWRDTISGHQHPLEGLTTAYAESWLLKVPVERAELRAEIIKGARETADDPEAPIYPLMLDLQVQHWRNLGARAEPHDFHVEAAGFEGRRRELVERLLRDYDDGIQSVLMRLSLLERFDRAVFEHLVKTFNIPLSFDVFDRLADLSIISAGDDGWLSMHRAIADAVAQSTDHAVADGARKVLLDHLTGRAKPEKFTEVSDETLACFSEAARLRLNGGLDGYVEWLGENDASIHGAFRPAFLEKIWSQALALARERYGEEHPDTATSYNNVACNLDDQGRLSEAEPLYQKALEICRRVLGEEHAATATCYNNVAQNLNAQGRLSEAEPLYRKALEISQRVLGEEHPDTATSYNNVASNLDDQGRLSEAEPLYRKALEIRQRVLGEEHPDTAASYNNVAYNLNAQGRHSEAEPLLRKALEIRQRVLGEEHPDTAASYNNVAYNLHAQGRLSEAEPLYRKALEIRQRVLGEEHPDTATSYNNVAANLNDQGRQSEAEPLYRKALEIFRRVLGEEHPSTATSYNNVAGNLDDQGRLSEAEPLHRKALEIRQRVLGEEHPDTAASYNNLACNLNDQGRLTEAEPLYQKALEISQRVLGEEHPTTQLYADNLKTLQDRLRQSGAAFPE